MKPDDLFSLLADPTRLRVLMLVEAEGELCVCELMFALDESQPKISRHLALMREAGIVESRREGTWMHYRLSHDLPNWSKEVLSQIFKHIHRLDPYKDDMKQLKKMPDRPGDRAYA
jgi:ArsR family transcriptional regulator